MLVWPFPCIDFPWNDRGPHKILSTLLRPFSQIWVNHLSFTVFWTGVALSEGGDSILLGDCLFSLIFYVVGGPADCH